MTQPGRQLGAFGGPGMNAVPTGKEANVAFEVYMPTYITTHLVVHT